MRPDTIKQMCRNSYSPEVKQDMAERMAKEVAELQQTRDEKKVSDAAFKERIEAHTNEIVQTATRYNRGYDLIEQDCDIRYNHPEAGKKTFVRMDNKEEVTTVDMTWEEKQEDQQMTLPTAETPAPEQVDEALNGIENAAAPPEDPKSEFREIKERIDEGLKDGPPRILPADEPPPEDYPF